MLDILSFAHVVSRCFGAFLILPLWEGSGLVLSRILLATLFAAAIDAPDSVPDNLSYLALGIEILFGICLAFPVQLLFVSSKYVGELLDSARGSSIAARYSPTSSTAESLLAVIFSKLLIVLLLFSGLLEQIFFLLAESFTSVPTVETGNLSLLVVASTVLESTIRIFTLGFTILLPVCVLFLMVEITFASIQFLLPAFQLHAEAFFVKSLILFVLLFSLLQLEFWSVSLPHMSKLFLDHAYMVLITS